MTRIATTVTVFSIALFCGGPAVAQQPAASERIEVQVTNIDVVVTDAEGKLVHGLTREDFVVLDDGKPQPLTNFAEYAGDAEAASGEANHLEPAAAAAFLQRPVVSVMIVIDHLHLRPATRAHGMAAISRFIAAGTGRRIFYLIASFDGSLRLHPAATAADANREIEAASRTAVSSVEMERERRHVLELAQTQRESDVVFRTILNFPEMATPRMQSTPGTAP